MTTLKEILSVSPQRVKTSWFTMLWCFATLSMIAIVNSLLLLGAKFCEMLYLNDAHLWISCRLLKACGLDEFGMKLRETVKADPPKGRLRIHVECGCVHGLGNYHHHEEGPALHVEPDAKDAELLALVTPDSEDFKRGEVVGGPDWGKIARTAVFGVCPGCLNPATLFTTMALSLRCFDCAPSNGGLDTLSSSLVASALKAADEIRARNT
jgi:hypothetical protein